MCARRKRTLQEHLHDCPGREIPCRHCVRPSTVAFLGFACDLQPALLLGGLGCWWVGPGKVQDARTVGAAHAAFHRQDEERHLEEDCLDPVADGRRILQMAGVPAEVRSSGF